MAKLCYENGLTKKPDIGSYIRVAMECLLQYIISQIQKERSAVMKQQKNKEGDGEAVDKREDQYENQAMIITPKGAGTTVGKLERKEEEEEEDYLTSNYISSQLLTS
jgi:hypothetical protein